MTLRTEISEPQRLNLVSTLAEAYNDLLGSLVVPGRATSKVRYPNTLTEDLSVLECAVEISEIIRELGA